MAKAAKELIEKNVHYQDGTPVECVISPCTIGGGAEAAKCAEYFSTQNVCASLAVTPCWCYGSETMDLSGDTVKVVWGFNGTERPGADIITLASMLRIPVTMHNVPEEKVYRPHAWSAFGTEEAQAADYAACKKYGSMYK